MRKNFNRDLNNQQTYQINQKKKLQKLQEKGMFGVSQNGEDFDVNQIKFFDVSDGFEPELLEMMNEKIALMKLKFQEWQVKQLEYVEKL